MDNAHKPAFPEPYLNDPNLALSTQPGLTKREYFAAMAMQGILSQEWTELQLQNYEHVSRIAVRHADELLKALSNEI